MRNMVLSWPNMLLGTNHILHQQQNNWVGGSRKLQDLLTFISYCTYLLDVLWGQLIKLIQVGFTLELFENQRNDLVFFKIIPSHFCRAPEASKVDCFKN